MFKRIVIAILLLSLAASAGAYFVSLDAPQDFPTNI
jgi:hypothetical protein